MQNHGDAEISYIPAVEGGNIGWNQGEAAQGKLGNSGKARDLLYMGKNRNSIIIAWILFSLSWIRIGISIGLLINGVMMFSIFNITIGGVVLLLRCGAILSCSRPKRTSLMLVVIILHAFASLESINSGTYPLYELASSNHAQFNILLSISIPMCIVDSVVSIALFVALIALRRHFVKYNSKEALLQRDIRIFKSLLEETGLNARSPSASGSPDQSILVSRLDGLETKFDSLVDQLRTLAQERMAASRMPESSAEDNQRRSRELIMSDLRDPVVLFPVGSTSYF